MEQLVCSGRLTMLNHTYLWKVTPSKEHYDEECESIRDDLFKPSADARKLYKNDSFHAKKTHWKDRKRSFGIGVSAGGEGSWLLRQSKARVLEKKLDRSWKCPHMRQFISQS